MCGGGGQGEGQGEEEEEGERERMTSGPLCWEVLAMTWWQTDWKGNILYGLCRGYIWVL